MTLQRETDATFAALGESHAPGSHRHAAAAGPHQRPLRVIVLTPGVGGLGGISRMMDNVSAEIAGRADPGVAVRFVSTRGDIRLLKPVLFVQALLRVAFFCATGHCDVLHINLASSGSTARKLVFGALADLCRTPYVIHLHGAEYREFWTTRGPLAGRIIDRFFRRAGAIIVLGRVWKEFVGQRVPEMAGRITILPNATPAPALRHSPRQAGDDIVITFLGRLGPRKGTPQLVAALAALAGQGWRAVLAGDGEVTQTRALVRGLGLETRVAVPGWVGPAEVEEILRATGIFVLPSVAENLPMSIIEAFAHGIPVIATPVGAVPEMVVDGQNGLLVPVGDSPALAAALQRLIADPALRQTLAHNARATHAAHYRLDAYTDRLIGLWQEQGKRERNGKHSVHKRVTG